MISRKKVFVVDKNYSLSQARKLMSLHGFSRVPYLDKNKKIVGILYGKDLLKKTNQRIVSLLKKPFFVFADDDITQIFTAMKKKKIHIAVVLDTDKNFVGIVTLEDILEELVGEIYDEFYANKFSRVK